MNKLLNRTYIVQKKQKKVFRIMKISFIISFICLFQLSATVYSQNGLFTIETNNTTMRDLFHEVEQQSSFRFFYNDVLIDIDQKVSIDVSDKRIDELMDIVLANSGITYRILNNKLIVVSPEALLQQLTLTGVVTDANGDPLPGVTVAIKGTSQGTATDANGAFSLQVPNENAVLVFSYIGFNTQEIPVGNRRTINVSLLESSRELEEVIVIGYGTVRKSDLAGSVSSVSNKQFRDHPVKQLQDILQGRTAGVEVTNTSGMLGYGARIRIRGNNSVNLSNSPLYVVDGIVGSELGINPSDIQSVEILKDASATAIYGSRGANGVILITTKRGEINKPQVTLDMAFGMSNIIKKYDLMNAGDYAQALYDLRGAGTISAADVEAYKNGTKQGIDWQDLTMKTGYNQDYKLSISGGTAKTKYHISANLLDQTAVTITSKYNRYQFRANLDTEVTRWLSVGTSLNGGQVKMHNANFEMLNMLTYSPTMNMFMDDGLTYANDPYNSYAYNPYGARMANDYDDGNDFLDGIFDLRFKIIEGLTLSVQGGLRYQHNRFYAFTSKYARPGMINDMGIQSNLDIYLQNTNNLTYQKSFGDHQITATAVWEISQTESKGLTITGSNLSNEMVGYWNVGLAANRNANNGYSAEAMASGVFRLMYHYKNRYLFTGTFRADGSSKFQADNKWGYFPSGAIAWDVAKEDFFSDQNIFQQLKVRTSYGVTGNQGIGRYSTLGMLTALPSAGGVYGWGTSTGYPGYWGGTFASPNVSWEKTYQYDAGVDVSVLNSRLNLSFDYFNKQTKDMLFQKTIPLFNGGGSLWVNQGEVKNTGVEIMIDAIPYRNKDFTWESVFNAGYVKNEVVDLAGEDRIFQENVSTYGGFYQILQPGYPMGTFYLYHWEGFDDQGANLYRSASGGLTTSPIGDDQVIMDKQGNPKWTFGWNNMISWKNWTANIFINAATGASRMNTTHYRIASMGANRFVTLYDAYYKSWDQVSNKADALYPSLTNPNNRLLGVSDFWLENASFLKLKNISIAYTIPKDKLKFVEAQLSLSAQNVYTLTKYKGMDPEVFNSATGIDLGAYPVPRTFTLGLKLNF